MTRLIAVGNRLMTDDAVGALAAEKLSSVFEQADIDVIVSETDAEYAFERIEEGDFLLILDAVLSGQEPGNVYVIPLPDAIKEYRPSEYQHDRSIFDLLKLSTKAYSGYFLGIEAAKIEIGNGLSKVLLKRFDELCSNIETAVFDLLRENEENARHILK